MQPQSGQNHITDIRNKTPERQPWVAAAVVCRGPAAVAFFQDEGPSEFDQLAAAPAGAPPLAGVGPGAMCVP